MKASYKVVTWHALSGDVKPYTIPATEAWDINAHAPTIIQAGLAARRKLAQDLGEDYDFSIHKVLSVEVIE